MRHDTITRRRTTHSRRRRSQTRPGRAGLADHILPGLRLAWRTFWQGVEHPRLVQGAVLLPLLLTVLALLAHLGLPKPAAASLEAPGKPQSSPTHHQCFLSPNACQWSYKATRRQGGTTASNLIAGGTVPARQRH